MQGILQKSLSRLTGASERRASDRFPIVRHVRYKIMGREDGPEAGAGTTINISSGGVLFSAQKPIMPGRRIELSISWPAQLDGKCRLRLAAQGRVVRCKGATVAIEIEKHEFRTESSRSFAVLLGKWRPPRSESSSPSKA